jgi:hypothetical protein
MARPAGQIFVVMALPASLADACAPSSTEQIHVGLTNLVAQGRCPLGATSLRRYSV